MLRYIYIIIMLLVAGCQTPRQEQRLNVDRERKNPEDYVRFLDRDLESKIKIVSVFDIVDVGLKVFQLNIRQESYEPFWIEYQIVFYTEDNVETEKTFWRPTLLIPKQDIGITGRATLPTSKKFIVYIRNYTGQPTPVR
ncbi:MAG: hypothetical protein ACK4NF_01455 [Planctomycetota bacterium]